MRVGTWSSTLRKEHRLRVFQNKVLRNFSELFGNEVIRVVDRKMKEQWTVKMCTLKSCVFCNIRPILLG
jgi:hypothetical protein